jgi:hypothetical protein
MRPLGESVHPRGGAVFVLPMHPIRGGHAYWPQAAIAAPAWCAATSWWRSPAAAGGPILPAPAARITTPVRGRIEIRCGRQAESVLPFRPAS